MFETKGMLFFQQQSDAVTRIYSTDNSAAGFMAALIAILLHSSPL